MAVEARFECTRKEAIDQTSVAITMSASIQGRDNVEWAHYTPAGSLTMTVNGPAGAEFVQGGRYRLLIEQVEDGQ
jgi:hypothetical protein